MITNINTLFDKIYVISVNATNNRINSLQERIPGLNYTLFEGIEGRNLVPQKEHPFQFPLEYFAQNNIAYDRFKLSSGGQLGCALSHQSIYKEVIINNYKSVLILEDDSSLESSNWNELTRVMNQLPSNWDLCYFGYGEIVKFQRSFLNIFLRWYHHFKKNKMYDISFGKYPGDFYPKKFRSFLKGGVYLGTYGYAISLHGAEVLYNQTIPLKYVADELLMEASYHGWLESFASRKPLIYHNNNFKSSQ